MKTAISGLGLVLVGVIVGVHSQLNAGTCVCLVIISGVTDSRRPSMLEDSDVVPFVMAMV